MFKQPGPGRPIKYTSGGVEPLALACTNYYELALALGLGWVSNSVTQPVVRAILRKVGLAGNVKYPRLRKSDIYPAVAKPITIQVRRPRGGRVKYTYDVLDPLVRSGLSIHQIALDLGTCSTAISKAIKRLGLTASTHSERYPRDLVARHVHACRNYYELALALGKNSKHLTGTVGLVRKLGLDASHFTRKPYTHKPGGVHFRRKATHWQKVLVLRSDGSTLGGDTIRRALLGSGRTYECAVCRLPPVWNGQRLQLQVDHVNGVRWDDRPENLRFICPNCHTQTDTFCGRNPRRKTCTKNIGKPGAPYGWVRDGCGVLVESPTEQTVLAQIRSLREQGRVYREIATTLSSQGVRSRLGCLPNHRWVFSISRR